MPDLVCELIISLDGFARGQRSPAYYGYFGPDFADWIKTNTALPRRILIGHQDLRGYRGTPAEARGEGWQRIGDNARLAVLALPGGNKPARAQHRPR